MLLFGGTTCTNCIDFCFYSTGHGFSGDYNEYFGLNTDTESFNYLTLANHMLHDLYPDFMITVAEVHTQYRQLNYIYNLVVFTRKSCCAILVFSYITHVEVWWCLVHTRWYPNKFSISYNHITHVQYNSCLQTRNINPWGKNMYNCQTMHTKK